MALLEHVALVNYLRHTLYILALSFSYYRPIHDAVEVGAVDIVKTLVEHGADPTAELGEKNPLDLAKENCHPEICDYLKRKLCILPMADYL